MNGAAICLIAGGWVRGISGWDMILVEDVLSWRFLSDVHVEMLNRLLIKQIWKSRKTLV